MKFVANINPIIPLMLEHTNTHYMQGGFQYVDDELQFFPHAEGYVRKIKEAGKETYNYIFNYTDHLGNIRLSYSDKNQDGSITSNTEIEEESNYYPFGLKHQGYNTKKTSYFTFEDRGPLVNFFNDGPVLNKKDFKYKYNGKEYQDELGLNFYDYGARNYDPALGRWMNIDPLAEKYPNWSPYNYTLNNPINMIDPDGREAEKTDDIIFKNKEGKETGRIKSKRINEVIVTDTELGKIQYDLDKTEEELGETVQAVGVYSEVSVTVGGGMFKGEGVVMMLDGKDAFKPKSFSTLGGNVGLEGSVGLGIEPFVSVLNPDFRDTHFNLDKYSGNYNGYAGSYKIAGFSFTWSNEKNTTDQLWPQSNSNSNSLFPTHRDNRYTWKTYSIERSFSLKTLFKKFNGGLKFMGGELKY